MTKQGFNLKIGSQNVRGINKQSKRIALFNWIKEKRFDVMLLQETFSSAEDENLWRSEWEGPIYYSHGSKHSCGVAVLVNKGFDFEPELILCDSEGRYVIVKAKIEEEMICIVNIYAPNTKQEKSNFFKHVHKLLLQNEMHINQTLIIGGDWNTCISSSLDKSGGRDIEDSVTEEMKLLLSDLELVDIWRLKNPNTKRYTYRQRKPLIQSRLDYFMVSSDVMDMTDQTQILASYCSDHSCVSLKLMCTPEEIRGPGFWKFNSTLLEDSDFVKSLSI